MVAIQDNLLDADQCQPQPRQDRGGGLRHIADVLDELFERFPLSAPEVEVQEIEEPVAVVARNCDTRQQAGQREEGDHDPTPGLLSVTTFAYPLVEITDCEALQKKIVKPLLNVIEQAAGAMAKGK
jgi:hypothetical protein